MDNECKCRENCDGRECDCPCHDIDHNDNATDARKYWPRSNGAEVLLVSWVRSNCKFAMKSNEYLKDLLSPMNAYPQAGPEQGSPEKNGISVFKSDSGSYRYVMFIEGVAAAAIQVMSKDGQTGVVANAYTHPNFRRQGLATALLKRIQKDFKNLTYSNDRSEEGNAFMGSFGL